MNILALDVAAQTGWATNHKGIVESGMFDCGTDDLGETGARFRRLLDDLLPWNEMVVIEAPFSVKRTLQSARCDGLVMIAHQMSYSARIPRTEVHAGTWRKRILGKGNLKRSEAKKLALIWARAQGFKPKDDNEAEALAILTWALETQAEAA